MNVSSICTNHFWCLIFYTTTQHKKAHYICVLACSRRLQSSPLFANGGSKASPSQPPEDGTVSAKSTPQANAVESVFSPSSVASTPKPPKYICI